jgi:hypothetical protein
VLVIEQDEDDEYATKEKKNGDSKKKKSNKFPREKKERVEGVIREAIKRSKSDLEVSSLARQRSSAVTVTAGQSVRPPATVTRAQSVYKVNHTTVAAGQSSSSSRSVVERTPRPPAPVTAPLVSRSAANSPCTAGTSPRHNMVAAAAATAPSSPAVRSSVAAVTTNSTYPRRRPSEFDRPMGRDTWRDDSAGFIQVADLELREEDPKKEVEKALSMRRKEEKEVEKSRTEKDEEEEEKRRNKEEEEEEELYQIPKHPVPVGVGKTHIFVCFLVYNNYSNNYVSYLFHDIL